MLAAFHGTSVTGAWAACSAIVALGNPILLGLGNYVLPNISNAYATSGVAAMQRQVHRSSLLFAVLLLPFVVVLAAYGDRLIIAIYGTTYSGTADVLFLLAADMVIRSIANPYSQGLFSLECAKADTLVNVLWVALLFTVGIAAVKFYAALGAAAALLVSSGVAALIRIGVFAREIRRPTPQDRNRAKPGLTYPSFEPSEDVV
jgi:O-antigen/teichoic acid export membrane protein